MNPLNPKKLLLTKWTAIVPVGRQKHFLVSRVIKPELPDAPIELVEIEAVLSRATQVIPWRALQNDKVWRQGWITGGLAAPDSAKYEAVADEFATHPDFADARADGLLWDATSLDGLTKPAN